ncbi:hypothetical protein GWI33_021802 [Rhynchophorus ferrugineus]|uniref:Uncharacterized protein n=1 Tax=Rhynchophorus ferrugineus TaxID=354439 RepID=A0A834MLI6_RHYFE|nr:hypothetical protein GWI33_021802 [Rhynchophorus ferrugineus]
MKQSNICGIRQYKTLLDSSNNKLLIDLYFSDNNQALVKYNPNPQAERPNNFQRNYIPPTRLNNISPPRPPTFAKDPLIPEPDYSPPGSLKKKSVLRPNSNYIM